ncbi:MBL fold metallo-hydrolase [Thermodesulfobacteriota bacterium]
MRKIKVSTGIYWVEVPEANFYCLCGCPADSVKHLMKRGLILPQERDGVTYESGPNAILLSDIPVQNGNFCNLSEFPVLQMLYRQGMILPNHPNNTGMKPLLIGREEQVLAQVQYIYRGNYGLASEDEIIQTGIPQELAREMMRVKLKFAFGRIRKTEEMVDTRFVDSGPLALCDNVMLERKSLNVYVFSYNGESVSVDLNLSTNESYAAPFPLGIHKTYREYFSVIHLGEGDGWDVNRGCMSSLITFQGKIYLIDAGPNIEHSLTAMGIGVNEIEGIFHTHTHDDHFAGLTTLIRSDHMIKYFATPLVRASVVKKLSALMSIEEDMFSKYFEIIDLKFDIWNDIEGLEVRPVLSPHPVETSIFFFRTLWENGYKTYAHFADVLSLDILKGMITEDHAKNGVTDSYFKKVKKEYLTPVDLKKIDVGGGLIHGNAKDYVHDASNKIILSHSALPLTNSQKEIGSNATFAMEDVLITTKQDYTMQSAFKYLSFYFPSVPKGQIRMLLNCSVTSFNAGSILLKKQAYNGDVFVILTGVVEHIESKYGINNILSVGSLIGEYSRLVSMPSAETYRSKSYIKALAIPGDLFLEFVNKNGLSDTIKQTYKNREFLQNTWLFGQMISFPILNRIAQVMSESTHAENKPFSFGEKPELIMLEDGELEISSKGKACAVLTPGDFAGEDSILSQTAGDFEACPKQPSQVKRIPGDILKDIPIVQWKLLETLERRK